MATPDRLAELISEYQNLDRTRDARRMCSILQEAAHLVDRQAEPKKWAALRSMYAQLADNDDPESALEAYRDALTVWHLDADRDSWMSCHMGIGTILFRLHTPGSPESEEAISELELVIDNFPFLAQMLATLYRFRVVSDPMENWQRRVKYLQLSISQVSQDQDPVKWAWLENEIGQAYGVEPNADFNQAVERRLKHHEAALAALGDSRDADWIQTCVDLCECYTLRTTGEKAQNLLTAEQFGRKAVKACTNKDGLGDPERQSDMERQSLLSLARALAFNQAGDPRPRFQEALSLYDQTANLIDANQKPELMANVEALRANLYLELMRMGEAQWLHPFLKSCEGALRGYNSHLHLSQRRVVYQMEGQGWLEVRDFKHAALCLEQAVEAGETALSQATTTAGRMERIFQLADSAALLSYCYLELGETERALNALDRGKTRLWATSEPTNVWEALPGLIPVGGAALFPVFGPLRSAVVVAARQGEVIRCLVAWLPEFNHTNMKELQSGNPKAGKLGGWMNAYCFRNSQPKNWYREIDKIGGILFEKIWSWVIPVLAMLGIGRGNELLWFAQSGSGVFPMHAAWRLENGKRLWLTDEYAVRYAPSVRSLLVAERGENQTEGALIVANPRGDLIFGDLECVWVERRLAAGANKLLAGDAATKEEVLKALPGCQIAHFSTHATFYQEDPFKSCFYLAGGGKLTLAELVPLLRKSAPQLVVLSACETAMTRVTATPDEFLGFPAMFLDHGTRTVLATLWPVEDSAAAFLIERFYQEHAQPGISAAEALRRAQRWLRTVEVRELMDLLRELRAEPPPTGPRVSNIRNHMRSLAENFQPYAQPYYWAAFTISGE